ncbi:glycosyltransferase family 39 protein [Paenibacillus sp. CC-CFT747]|nr:glycosyltransferase family 39 protein [Paenibacillus sp. CC-CFT747]
MKRRYYSYGIGAILLLALALRLHYVLTYPFEPVNYDQLNYTKLAIQWLEKGVYAYRDTAPNTLVTPGFPAFLTAILGLFGYEPLEPALMTVRIIQCFVALGAIFFIYKIGERLFHPATGLLAALFAAVHPSYAVSVSLILTEVLFLTCFTAFLYFQVRVIQDNKPWDHVGMGILLGLTVLIRPNVLPLAVVPYFFLWFTHRKLFLPMIVRSVAAFAIIMMPWWIRNALTFHTFIPIAKGESGNPFLGGTDPYFRGTIDWGSIKEEDQMKEGIRRLKEGLREDPSLWIRWYTIGKFKVFNLHIWQGAYPSYVPQWYATLIQKLHFALVYIGWPALPLLSLMRSRSALYLTVSLFIFYGIHAMFIPVDRYIYGMLPFLMLGTAQLLVTGLELLLRKQFVKNPVRT